MKLLAVVEVLMIFSGAKNYAVCDANAMLFFCLVIIVNVMLVFSV